MHARAEFRRWSAGIEARSSERSVGELPGLRMVVVAGCQRSGTSLTGHLLGAHPAALLIDETDGIYEWADAWMSGRLAEQSALHLQCLQRAAQKYRDPAQRLGADGRPTASITHLILKAPNLSFAAARLAGLAQRPQVVFPVRDPRAVVASLQALDSVPILDNQLARIKTHADAESWCADFPEFGDEAAPMILRWAALWAIKSRLYREFERRELDPLVFRFEDLLSNPRAMQRRLWRYTGLPAAAVEPLERVYAGRGVGGFEREQDIDPQRARAWRGRLAEDERRSIRRRLQPLMSQLDYLPEPLGAAGKPAGETRRPVAAQSLEPLIVLGRGGSGTRLLSALLRANGVWLGDRINQTGDSMDWVDLLYAMALDLNPRRPLLLPQRWQAPLQAQAQRMAEQAAGRPWGWKLPETMLALPEVLAAFPRARVIHLVRHPVTSSLRRSHLTSRSNNEVGRSTLLAAYRALALDEARVDADEDWQRNALTWRFQLRLAQRSLQAFLPRSKVLTVHFEALQRRPEHSVRQIAEFVGIENPTTAGLEWDRQRSPDVHPEDPRVAQVWQLCASTAAGLGYDSAESALPRQLRQLPGMCCA